MKALFICFVFVLSLQNINAQQFDASVEIPDYGLVNFSYRLQNIEKDSLDHYWIAPWYRDAEIKLGHADWFIVTYSGGVTVIIGQTGEYYISYWLIAESFGKVPYSQWGYLSGQMIKEIVGHGQTVNLGLGKDTESVIKNLECKIIKKLNEEVAQIKLK